MNEQPIGKRDAPSHEPVVMEFGDHLAMWKAKGEEASSYLRMLADEIEARGIIMWNAQLRLDTVASSDEEPKIPGRWRALEASWLLAPTKEEALEQGLLNS